jgi:hypothetical protein
VQFHAGQSDKIEAGIAAAYKTSPDSEPFLIAASLTAVYLVLGML